jgi:two-component system CheB/CheR fusion protein
MPNLPIVGIGASAGGVEALEQFFKSMPADNGMGFVVVTHLPPNRESMLAGIIGRATQMPVVDAREGEMVEAGHVYVLPPGAVLTIREGRLRLRHTATADHERTPINLFFTSLAQDQAEHAIGIVLSGTGSDGTLGLKAIKDNGGLTVAQGANVTRPRFAQMPLSAVAAGFVDLVLPVEDIPDRIIAYVRNWGAFDPQQPVDALSTVHRLLHTRTGHDFSEYKDRTFQRRVQRRMQVVQTARLEEYVEQLQKDPDEVRALLRDLLIGVTDFFRDDAAFRALETSVLPKLFEGKNSDDEVRVWVVGCATGEEAYSIAILLREHMDTLKAAPKVQIFATDIDEAAMGVARTARYSVDLVKGVSPERLKRFFVHETGTYHLVKDLREMCIFSTHSVIRDPPFSRLDLISNRNLLIYMKPSLQEQIIPLLHYALRPGGYLFLGPSENVGRYAELFRALDKKNRIFQRRGVIARPSLPFRLFLPESQREGAAAGTSPSPMVQRSELLHNVANTIVERFGPTYVLVDSAGVVLYFSAGTGKYLQIAAGLPSRDVLAMASPGLRVDLRTALHRAKESGRRVRRDRIPIETNGGVQVIDLVVEPITRGGDTTYGIVFADHVPTGRHDESGSARRPAGEDDIIQQIEKELQETKERLQSTIEELETANEEFRSANEELMSVNEEMQSSNEEIESSKEELQSVNEELHAVNSELSNKVDELNRANSDLNYLFQSTEIATIFLDQNLAIRSFTPPVTKLFNLIPSDHGRQLTDFVSRLAYPDLENDIRAVFGGEVIERAVSLANGKRHFLARILPYRTAGGKIDGVLLTFVDITGIAAVEEQLRVLAAELSHRVKNTLAVVSSIAERTLPDTQVKTDLIGRFQALGHTHDVLSDAGWTEAGLRDLVLAELAPHAAGDGSNVTVYGPPVMLKPQAALFLALVIHELSTNAAKYGALSVSGGRVEVAWTIARDHPPRLELSWIEHGGPQIHQMPRYGFGTELIERGIRFELQGEAKLETVDGDLQCRIVLPANPEHPIFGSPFDAPISEEAAS